MLLPKEQLPILQKGVHLLIREEDLLSKLEQSYASAKPLVVKLGLDPSAPDIHLGHTVVLRKIRQFQDLGHQAVIIIGDFTGKIGDPTGKTKGRVALSEEKVRENARTYCRQIFRVLDPDRTQVRYNSDWLSALNFEEILELSSTMTVARMLERDDFQKRYTSHIPIGLHEFFYPLMQAYDSVAIQADIEIGGTDQTFNVLAGRTLQKSMGLPEQVCLFMPLLEGLDGKEKMSKSLGNYIGVNEEAPVLFKKVMEVPDRLILRYFELVTDLHPNEIETLQTRLQQGENPRDIKYLLAQNITSLYHCADEVARAMTYYKEAFQQKSTPQQIPQLVVFDKPDVTLPFTLNDLIPFLIREKYLPSKSEFLRLLNQGGIRLNDQRLTAEDRFLPLSNNDVLRIGKKKFLRLL